MSVTTNGLKNGVATIQDLIGIGPSDPGFYVASGTRQLIPFLFDRLVDFLGSEYSARASSGDVLSRPGPLIWVDSGNLFDPHAIALAAARRGMNPVRLLRAFHVARPFTAFQYQQMLRKVPVSVGCRYPFVILSDLMGLFYDPEIQERDVRRAFQGFLVQLALLKKRAVILGLQFPYEAPSARRHFLPHLLAAATRISSRPRSLLFEEPHPVLAESAA